MGETRITINRRLVGLVAAMCLATAVVLVGVYLSGEQTDAGLWAAMGAFIRAGLFMGALWLAFPRGKRQIDLSLKTLVLVAAGLGGVIVRPKFFIPVVIVVGFLALLLKPRDRRGKQKELAARYRDEASRQEK